MEIFNNLILSLQGNDFQVKSVRTCAFWTARHLDTYGTCLFCDLVQEEQRLQERVVLESEYFLVFVPYAPQSTYETWVIPKIHKPSFGLIDDTEVIDLARILNQILGILHRRLNDPDYNLTLNTPPVREARQECCHWHIRILPRMSYLSGFELGSGIYPPTQKATGLQTVDECGEGTLRSSKGA
jgi:UDPglucose--hexose-1-phosphate uridylyltransferase